VRSSNVPTGFCPAPGARNRECADPLEFLPMLPDMWVTRWCRASRSSLG
jgi:hypothetical protein